MFKKLALISIIAVQLAASPAFAQTSASEDKNIRIFMGAAVSCSKVVQQSNYAVGTEKDCLEVKGLLDQLINTAGPMSAREMNYAVLSNMLVHQTIGSLYVKNDGLDSVRNCAIVRQARAIKGRYANGLTVEADETMGKVVKGIEALAANC